MLRTCKHYFLDQQPLFLTYPKLKTEDHPNAESRNVGVNQPNEKMKTLTSTHLLHHRQVWEYLAKYFIKDTVLKGQPHGKQLTTLLTSL